jgi:hypothetical protein
VSGARRSTGPLTCRCARGTDLRYDDWSRLARGQRGASNVDRRGRAVGRCDAAALARQSTARGHGCRGAGRGPRAGRPTRQVVGLGRSAPRPARPGRAVSRNQKTHRAGPAGWLRSVLAGVLRERDTACSMRSASRLSAARGGMWRAGHRDRSDRQSWRHELGARFCPLQHPITAELVRLDAQSNTREELPVRVGGASTNLHRFDFQSGST